MIVEGNADTGQRKLGFWMCTALVVATPSASASSCCRRRSRRTASTPRSGWLVTVLGCVALARVFARLAREMPNADGPYGYIRSTLGDIPAFLSIWCYWVSLWITNAAIATGVVGYLGAVFPGVAQLQPALVALALLWAFVAINLFGVRTGGRVQVATTALKLLPMVAVALLGAWLLLTQPAVYTQHLPSAPLRLGDIVTASTVALFAMLGLESATVPAARVKDPARTIPRATIAGTVLTAVIYIIVSTVPMLLIPEAELATTNAPFATVMDRFAAAGVGRWLALFVVVSGLGALNGWTLLVGELTRTMAENGVMPAALARNNRRGAPAVALVVTGLLGSGMVLMSYSKVARRRLHLPQQGRDRRQPPALPVLLPGAGDPVAPWRGHARGARDAGHRLAGRRLHGVRVRRPRPRALRAGPGARGDGVAALPVHCGGGGPRWRRLRDEPSAF
jgi:APA family basic amino acid/polyamine antiporter